MFSPGETVVHNFVIPFKKTDVTKVLVTYMQHGYVVQEVEIASEDLRPFTYFGFVNGERTEITDVNKSVVSVAFTQFASLAFEDEYIICAQLNVLFGAGSRCTSKEIKINTNAQYYKEVLE